MNKIKSHIVFKLSIVILVIAILTPTIVKLAHTLEDHDHIVCTDPQTTHFHSFELDCEFYKFKLQTQTFNEFVEIDINEILDFYHIIDSNYQFHTNATVKLCFLRGPPELV